MSVEGSARRQALLKLHALYALMLWVHTCRVLAIAFF